MIYGLFYAYKIKMKSVSAQFNAGANDLEQTFGLDSGEFKSFDMGEEGEEYALQGDHVRLKKHSL